MSDTLLQIKNFPEWLRKWLKQKALDRDTSMRQVVIEIITKAHSKNGGKCA